MIQTLYDLNASTLAFLGLLLLSLAYSFYPISKLLRGAFVVEGS